MAKPKVTDLSTLVEDFTLYPRHAVDDTHVADLVRAIQAGATLPPIVACADTLRIVDGFHRLAAWRRLKITQAPVEFRTFASDTDLFLAAVEMNAHHGRRLDRHDQTRIVLKLRAYGVEDKTISMTLHVPEPVIQVLSMRVVYETSGEAKPSKRGLEWLRGKEVTAEQSAVIDGVRSADVGRMALELTQLIETGLVNREDAGTMERLVRLRSALDEVLVAAVA